MSKSRKKTASLPSKDEILDYVREAPGRVNRREVARAFGIKGERRVALKAMLRELEEEGLIARGPGKRLETAGGLPKVTVLEITGTDPDGELMARPARWLGDAPPPPIYVMPERGRRPAVATGERVLARLQAAGDGTYEARIMKRLARPPQKVLGQYRLGPQGGRVEPTDRRLRHEFLIGKGDAGGARPGDLVLIEPLHESRQRMRPLGPRPARVVERVGHFDEPRAISLISIHANGIPVDFSAEALALAAKAEPVSLGKRVDLRDVPLVTIDGADARDFDDAVWAEPDPESPGGWHAIVAIADVGYYVRPGDALDRAAYERGNSVYFPDRVVPMLPEALSNELCSLKPGVDRACLAAHLWIGADGRLRGHRFERALMRSAARLTYSQVQAAHEGLPDETTGPLRDSVLAPLYGVFETLLAARVKRGALDIELPEFRIALGPDGRVESIAPRQRLDSHRLIEELMITANVATAETLERLGQPCMYRVHEPPDPAKIHAVGEFLGGLGYRITKSQSVKPAQFNRVLAQARGGPHERLVNELILRCQSQAVYSPDNRGHFGLALRRYAHFTSPIRRYADLLVHRALVGGLRLGPDGVGPFEDAAEAGRFAAAGEHISVTERRAMAAERDAVDRYMAAYLGDRVGGHFSGRINGVTRFGLFVTLDETGGDGLVPMRSLPPDSYRHDEARHQLVGRHRGIAFGLGDTVEVRLTEANPLTGGLIFDLVAGGRDRDSPAPGGGRDRGGRREKRARRGRK